MTEWENQCYGCSEAEVLAALDSNYVKNLAGTRLYVLGLLSDIQEMEEHDYTKREVIQAINRVKLLLSVVMDEGRRAA